MANINTSGAASGRDFSYGASRIREPDFLDLYDDIINKLNLLTNISDETTFKIELNKIRKKMHKLITQYFESSLSELQTMGHYKDAANSHVREIIRIREKLNI
jgi:hypothetical protein